MRMPTAEGRACHLERLAVHRFGLVVLALHLQLRAERAQGEVCCLATHALCLEPCTQQLDAQRVTVLVPALAAAVGRILLRARSAPLLEAAPVDPLGGATAGARLDELSIVLAPEAQAAPLLLCLNHLLLATSDVRPPGVR